MEKGLVRMLEFGMAKLKIFSMEDKSSFSFILVFNFY